MFASDRVFSIMWYFKLLHECVKRYEQLPLKTLNRFVRPKPMFNFDQLNKIYKSFNEYVNRCFSMTLQKSMSSFLKQAGSTVPNEWNYILESPTTRFASDIVLNKLTEMLFYISFNCTRETRRFSRQLNRYVGYMA